MATVIHCVGSAPLEGTVRRWIGAKIHLDIPSNTSVGTAPAEVCLLFSFAERRVGTSGFLIHIPEMWALWGFQWCPKKWNNLKVNQIRKEPRQSPMLVAVPLIYHEATQTVKCENRSKYILSSNMAIKDF